MKKLLMVLVTLAVCLALLPVGSSNIQADGPTPVSVPAEEGDASIQADGPTPVNVPAADENADFVDIVGVPQLVAAPEGKLEVFDGIVGMPQSVEAPEEEISVNTSQVDSRGVSPTLPGDFHASAGSVTVTSVWTADGSGNNKSTFNCGDSIRYYGNVYNNTGSSKTASFSWSVTGPCGSIASWSGNQTTPNGNASWYLPATIPSNACAGTYTYKLSVTYSGSTTSKSITFTVNCGGGVTVTSVWTTDGSGNNKTTFNCGDSIRYYGNVYNNTGSSKTASFSWSVTGPCGSIASWSGNQTTPNGNASWYLPATIPSNACAGTYTYKLSVTYSGSTTAKSITFAVQCGSLISIPYISQYQDQSTQNHDCGPASVAMVLEAYGKRPAGILNRDWIVQVRSHSGNSSGNLTWSQLEAAIGWYGIGFTEIAPTLSPAPDKQMEVMKNALAAKKPVIALVHGDTLGRGAAYGDHFVVVRGFSGDGQYVYINDPDNRCRSCATCSVWLECGGAQTWSYSRFRQACYDAAYDLYGITVGNGL